MTKLNKQQLNHKKKLKNQRKKQLASTRRFMIQRAIQRFQQQKQNLINHQIQPTVQHQIHDQYQKIIQRNMQLAMRQMDINIQKSQSQQSKSQPTQKIKQTNANQTKKLTSKQRKKQLWLKVAHLKAVAKRPDLVQAWDVTSSDPALLLHLKGYKNTVAVPRHWNQKTRYLQTKRGILKPPFKLPEYIQSTGISKLRDPFMQNGISMVKQKLKQRMNPRLGKIDIDYQVLHDAFFKYQTKPILSKYGDTYYQGKQNQSGSKQFRPGILSQQLRTALGIGDFNAPPWIINMQRYGSPPAYPTLHLLGSNPIMGDTTSFSIVTKAVIQQYARKSGRAGLYATFRGLTSSQKQPISSQLWGQFKYFQEEQIPQPDQIQEQFNLN